MRHIWLGLLLCAMVAPQAHAQQPRYTLVQVGQDFSPAMDVNDDGTVVGWWVGPPVSPAPNTESRGYLWTLSTGMRPIISDAATVSMFPFFSGVANPAQPLRISNGGVVAGTGCPLGCGTSGLEAAIWSADQGLQFLGAFNQPPQGPSSVTGINATSQLTGFSWGGGYNNYGPFVWSAPGGFQPLVGFSGLNGMGLGINRDGLIVGIHGDGSRETAMLWSSASGETLIPDLPGTTTSAGLAINDPGTVVGRFNRVAGGYGVFRYTAANGVEDLHAPAGYPETLDINNAGDVVATIIPPAGGSRIPYLFHGGAWTDLNTLLPTDTIFRLQFVEAINNNGWIAGSGTTDPGGAELGLGFVLIPSNTAPVATSLVVSTDEDVPVNGMLAAADPDGDVVTFAIQGSPSRGTVSLTDAGTGAFRYAPAPNASGTDSFTFSVSDGRLTSNTASVTLQVNPVNDAPTANSRSLSATAGQTVVDTLTANDVDSSPLNLSIVSNATRGTATITNAATGAFTYRANIGATGPDTFTFRASDGLLDSNIATVTVSIDPAPACAAEITAGVSVTLSAPKLDRKTGRYTQNVTLRNNGNAVAGPLSFVLDGLSSNATLLNTTGTTTCIASGRPYVNVEIGADGTFSSRERATLTLEFANPSGAGIVYAPRVVAGPGAR